MTRRPFSYTPPPGWVATEGVLGTVYRDGDALLVIYPAQPVIGGATVELMVEHLVARAPWPEPLRVDEAVSCGGLPGWRVILGGRDGRAAIVLVVDDGRYLYPMRLETGGAGLLTRGAQLDALAASIRPLPRPPMDRAAIEHWTD